MYDFGLWLLPARESGIYSMLVTVILFIMRVGIVSVISSLDVSPLNKAVLAGQRMELKCKTSQSETVNRWTVTRVGRNVDVIFRKSANQNNTSVDARFGQDGDDILYLNRTELKDAGVYTCFKNEDAVKSSAHLIVLESIPACKSNISEGDNSSRYSTNISMWCRVNFSTVSNWSPNMEWIQHHKGTQLIRNDSITTTTNTTVASVLHVSISSIENGSYFTCITFFKSYDGPVQTTASNIPDIRFIWNSTKIILQESTTSSTAKYVDGTRIRMATALIDGKGSNSSSDNYWFSVSLSMVAVVSIFFILMAIMALNFYIYRKRITTGGGDPVQEASLASLDQPMSGPYDEIDFTYYEDGYDNIDDNKGPDCEVSRKIQRRKRPPPTPGYEGLLPQRNALAIYSPIDNGEQPSDKEDIKISPEHAPNCEQHLSVSKSLSVEQSVTDTVKCPAYTEIIG